MSSAGTHAEFDFASSKAFVIIRLTSFIGVGFIKSILSIRASSERMCHDMCFNTEDRGEGREAK